MQRLPMNAELEAECVETEIGVRFTGTGGGLFVEPWSDPVAAQARCAMYQRKGDAAAEVVKRKVVTRTYAWESTR